MAPNPLPEKNLVFFVTPGRSGTDFVAHLLSHLPETTVAHEPAYFPWMVFREAFKSGRPVEHFTQHLRETKLPALQKITTPHYIETDHRLSKGLFEPMEELGLRFNLVVLFRAERKVARSHYQINAVPGRSLWGKRYYYGPEEPLAFLQLPKAKARKLTEYQVCYWYTLEIRARQFHYASRYQRKGRAVVFATLEHFKQFDFLQRACQSLGLPVPPEQDRDRFERAANERVNTKKTDKRDFPLSMKEVEEQEAEVETLVRKYAYFPGLDLPLLPSTG